MPSVERSACFAFCPPKALSNHADSKMGYLCGGTMAGAFDMSFSSTATCEIFSLDPPNVLERRGVEVESHERFHRLVWGALPNSGEEYPLGVIAGGLVDGSVNLFNPDCFLSSDPEVQSKALICPLKKHQGAVKGLEFNPFSGNLLASGGADGDVCIWDVANPTKPSLFPALKDSGMQKGEITALSWNKKVQHILASTTSSGSTIVWDLKRQRQVISFGDSGGSMGKRCSALQWHPEIATQLIVASDDDRFPILQVWDLRNSISPCKEFKGHEKGVLSLAWSELDPSLLLSTGKDNRTILWDAYAGEVLSDMPRSQNWNFDAQWCPTVPGWFATASFDGVVSTFDVVQGMGASNPEEQQQQQQQGVQGDFDFNGQQQTPASTVGLNRMVAKRAPKWMGRPCGVAFGFGGKFVSFCKAPAQTQQGPGPAASSSMVSISSIPGDDSLVKYAKDLTQLVSDTGKDTMVAFCEKKKGESSSKQEQELWEFMKMLYEGNTRDQLLKYLGYEPAAPEQQQPLQEEAAAEAPSANGLVKATNDLSLDGDMDEINKQLQEPPAAFNDEDFFDNLQGVPSPMPSPTPKQALGEAATEKPTEDAAQPEVDASEEVAEEDLDDVDTEIKHALFVANYAKAVEICLEAGKMADALLIASLGGADLWAKTQKEYVKKNSKGYMKVLLSIMDNNLKTLVQQQHPQNWRETLALLCTYAQSEEWSDLCSNLGDLLLTRGGDVDSAVLCYICAGNLDNAVRLWSQNIDLSQDKTELNYVMEKAIVLSLATEQQSSQAYGDLLNMYADLLASSGQISEALEFLNCIPGELSESTATLKERLSQAGARLESAAQAATTGGQDYANQQQVDYSQQGQGYYSQPQDYSQQQEYSSQQGYNQQQGYNASQNYSSYQDSSYGGGNYQNTSQYNNQPTSYSQPSYDQSQYYQQPPASQPAYDQQYQQPGYGGGQAYVPSQPAAPPVNTMTPMESAPQQQQQPALFNPMAAAAAPTPAQTQMFTPQAGQSGPPMMAGGMAPSAAAPPSPKVEAKPAAPQIPSNISVASADVSKVAADLKPVVACLTESYNICAKAYEGNPGKKREVDDNSRRLGILFFKLNMGDIKPSVKASLLELCKALSARDFMSASKIHISLTTTDFDECGQWLTALKRIIKTRQQVG